MTVSSRERNSLPGGDKKININNGIVAEMFDFLEEEFVDMIQKGQWVILPASVARRLKGLHASPPGC